MFYFVVNIFKIKIYGFILMTQDLKFNVMLAYSNGENLIIPKS